MGGGEGGARGWRLHTCEQRRAAHQPHQPRAPSPVFRPQGMLGPNPAHAAGGFGRVEGDPPPRRAEPATRARAAVALRGSAPKARAPEGASTAARKASRVQLRRAMVEKGELPRRGGTGWRVRGVGGAGLAGGAAGAVQDGQSRALSLPGRQRRTSPPPHLGVRESTGWGDNCGKGWCDGPCRCPHAAQPSSTHRSPPNPARRPTPPAAQPTSRHPFCSRLVWGVWRAVHSLTHCRPRPHPAGPPRAAGPGAAVLNPTTTPSPPLRPRPAGPAPTAPGPC